MPPTRSLSVRELSTGVSRTTSPAPPLPRAQCPRLTDRAGARAKTSYHSGIATTASISTLAPRGSSATPIVTRAGGSRSKNEPYTSLTAANEDISVV